MGFTLKVDFMCLCFFVPDRPNGRVHVLMPSTCHEESDADPIEPHRVSLMYPLPGGGLDALGHEVAPGQVGVNDYKDMKGWTLVLGEDGPPAKPDLPPQIANVTPFTGFVDRSLLGPAPGAKVASRVTLASGAIRKTHPAAKWKFDGREVEIAQRIVWEMTLPGDRLTWSRTRIADGHVDPLPPIDPTGGVVKLEIHHTTKECFPVPRDPVILTPDAVASHFAAFYTLFSPRRNVPLARVVPEFAGFIEEDLPVSCMAGKGRL